MMTTAGVEPDRQKCNACKNCSTCQLFKGIIGNRLNKFKTIEECQKASILYPYFTPAKQLEIIKLILLADDIDYLNQYHSEILDCYVVECFSLPELRERSSWTTQNKYFELALAELTVMLMNSGELDKKKVKEILEG